MRSAGHEGLWSIDSALGFCAWTSTGSYDRLHVTLWRGSGSTNSIQVISRQGQSASQAAAPTRAAADPDLGTRHAVADLSGRGAPAIPCGRQESLRQGGPGLHRRCLGLGCEVKRGEIWTVAGGKDYAGKPRPVVIVQDDRFDMTNSVTVCAFTTDP